MSDPLADPILSAAWGTPDLPMYQQTVAALGYCPPSRLARVLRDASRGANRAGMWLSIAAAATQFSRPRNVWTRFNRACWQSGIDNPIRPTAYGTELDSWRPLR